jgi:hypothetical protein
VALERGSAYSRSFVRTRPAFAASALLAALLVCGCDSVVDGSKREFSREFTCPVDRVAAHPRPELHPSGLEHGTPPREIAADPGRLRMWQDQQAKLFGDRDSRDDIIELTGCGHHVLYGCHRFNGRFNRFFCKTEPLPPVLEPALTLATLATSQLESTPKSMVAPEIVGTYQAFDMVANYDWASTLGAAWRPDAKLYRIDAGHFPFDAKIDLASRGSTAAVTFYFNSRAKGDADLYLDVSPPYDRQPGGGTVDLRVYSHGDTTARDPLPKPTCSLERAISVLRDIKGPSKPKTDSGLGAELLTVAGKPCWYLQYVDAAGKAAAVEVNSSTCAVEHPQ